MGLLLIMLPVDEADDTKHTTIQEIIKIEHTKDRTLVVLLVLVLIVITWMIVVKGLPQHSS